MKIKYIALVASLFMSVGAIAQHNEEVTIEGAYRPKVNKVNKIVLRPETPEQSYTMPGSEVNVLDVERRFGLNIEKISHRFRHTHLAPVPLQSQLKPFQEFGPECWPQTLLLMARYQAVCTLGIHE